MANSDWAAEALGTRPPSKSRWAEIAERDNTTPAPPVSTVVTIDLSKSESWPTSVWVAFSKANHERVAANIAANEHRRVAQAGAHIV